LPGLDASDILPARRDQPRGPPDPSIAGTASTSQFLQRVVTRPGPLGCHTLRHSFATHSLDDDDDIGIVHQPVVSMSMIRTHALNRGPNAVRSPAGRVFGA
jgi:integrase